MPGHDVGHHGNLQAAESSLPGYDLDDEDESSLPGYGLDDEDVLPANRLLHVYSGFYQRRGENKQKQNLNQPRWLTNTVMKLL